MPRARGTGAAPWEVMARVLTQARPDLLEGTAGRPAAAGGWKKGTRVGTRGAVFSPVPGIPSGGCFQPAGRVPPGGAWPWHLSRTQCGERAAQGSPGLVVCAAQVGQAVDLVGLQKEAQFGALTERARSSASLLRGSSCHPLRSALPRRARPGSPPASGMDGPICYHRSSGLKRSESGSF